MHETVLCLLIFSARVLTLPPASHAAPAATATAMTWEQTLERLRAASTERMAGIWSIVDQALRHEHDERINEAIHEYMRSVQFSDSLGATDLALAVHAHVLDFPVTPYHAEACVQAARILMNRHEAERARQVLQYGLDAAGAARDVRVHTLLGIANMQQTRDDEAIAAFDRAVELEPDGSAFAHEKLGELHSRNGRLEPALRAWHAADALYSSHEQYRDALRVCEVLIQYEPHNTDLQRRLAELRKKFERPDDEGGSGVPAPPSPTPPRPLAGTEAPRTET
jgi:tetratricopeptide (TPR) repeat protein